MSKLRFCPNCGAALESENAALEIYDDRSGDGGYDCYCQSCEWSGDVWPDEEQAGNVAESR